MFKAMFQLMLVVGLFSAIQASDTLIVESVGHGQTSEEATNDAIRKASEQSLGMLLSSTTLIENYMIVRDAINTSANAYVYKYETLSTDFDPNSNMFTETIKAYITKDLLLKAVNSKIVADTIDMTPIERTRFEMIQARERAKSAITYYGAFIQNNFRDYVKFQFDSISVLDQDIISMKAKIEVHYSLYLTEDIANFSTYDHMLRNRLYEFSNKEYYTTYSIIFNVGDIKYEVDEHIGTGRYDDDHIHFYRFFIQNHFRHKDSIESGIYTPTVFIADSISKKVTCYQTWTETTQWVKEKFYIEDKYTQLYSYTMTQDSINKYFYSFDINNSPCVIEKDTVTIPFMWFLFTRSGSGAGTPHNNPLIHPRHANAFTFPLFGKFNRIKPNYYSNSFVMTVPIDSLKPELLNISYDVNIIELNNTGRQLEKREFNVINQNKTIDVIEIFQNF